MAVYTYLTNVGAQRIISAYGDSAQINVISAQLSPTSLYNSNITTMTNSIQALTALPNIEYTSPQNTILYNDYSANSLMLKVFLGADVGTFTFSSFAIIMDDGVTPLVIGTYDSPQSKAATNNTTGVQGDVRYLEVIIPFANIGNVINFSSITQDNGSLPELTADTSLPAANAAPFPVYFLHDWTNGGNFPAMAGRWNNAWYYFPCNQWILDEIQAQAGNYAIDSSNTANTIVLAYNPVPTIVAGLVLRFKANNTVTGNTVVRINGNTAVALLNPNGNQLIPNQVGANSIYEMMYDGIYWRLLSITSSDGIPPVYIYNSNALGPTALTAGQSGSYIEVTGTTSLVLILPASGAGLTGCNFTIFNRSTNTVQLNSSGGSFIGPNGNSASVFTMWAATSITIFYDGSNWITAGYDFAQPHPVSAQSTTGGYMNANQTYSIYVTLTTPIDGYIYASGGHNLNLVATASSSGSPGLQGNLTINATVVSADNTLLSQSHFGTLQVSANTAVTITYSITTSVNAPQAQAGFRVAATFIPLPN